MAGIVNKILKKSQKEQIKKNLIKAGSPLGLTPETYILTKSGVFIFALIYILLVEMEGLQGVVFAVFSFFIIDIYIHFEKRDKEKAFRGEMPEIVDVFELATAADIPLDDTFLLATSFADRKEVKRELAKLSAGYFITRDKEGCLKRFSNSAGLPEVDVLSMSILQGERTGKVTEILSSLSKSLYNTAIAKVAREDKLTDYKVLAAIFVLMVSIALLYMYPYFTNVEGGIRSIF